MVSRFAPAIVWQDRRATEWCNQLTQQNLNDTIHTKDRLTYQTLILVLENWCWLLEHVQGLRELAEQGHVAFGTIDSWLVWNLTQGAEHVIEAKQCLTYHADELYSIKLGMKNYLNCLIFPHSVLPKIISSDQYIADTATGLLGADIPITGILGDQQSALFGQSCFEAGTAKNTYGTGCFMLFNTGTEVQYSHNKLLCTLAWQAQDQTHYALEGSVFMAGAIVQWLRDGLGIIQKSSEVETLACQVEHTDGVVLVPAFTGLGAPHWDSDARALLCGMSRGTNKSHIAVPP